MGQPGAERVGWLPSRLLLVSMAAFIASSGLGLLIEVAEASDVCGALHLVGVV